MNRNATYRFFSMAALALGLMGMGPGSCGSGTDPTTNPCEGLDEQTCASTAGCKPLYFQPQCTCDSCPEGLECPPCSCGEYSFASCGVENEPPTGSCSGLSEAACFAEPGCEPVYFSAEPGTRCGSERCLGAFAGCAETPEKEVCEALDEQACLARSDCEATYDNGTQSLSRCAADPDLRCLNVAEFTGCKPVSCQPVMCDLNCAGGLAVDEHGCEVCRCNRGCLSDSECGPGEICELPFIKCPPNAKCAMPTGVCVQAQERPCSRDLDCQAGEVCRPDSDYPCPGGVSCMPPIGLTCQPACSALDESACVARRDCRGVHTANCIDQGCDDFRCEDAGQVCPPVICPACASGYYEVDANGCQTCACRPAGCTDNSQCANGEVCLVPNQVTHCVADETCATTGFCAPAGSCLSDSDCPTAESCFFLMTTIYGTCGRSESGCTSDADCALGQACEMPLVNCYPSGNCGPVEGVCVDRACSLDADCAAGSVCRPDPKDPCSSPGVECVYIARHICQAPCAGLDWDACLARPDCRGAETAGCTAEGCSDIFRCEDASQVCSDFECDIWCPNGFEVDENGCQTCACRPAGCTDNSQCASGEVCLLPSPVVPCAEGVTCAITGICAPADSCLSDSDCPTGESCFFLMTLPYGTCGRNEPDCYRDSDCGAGERCELNDCGPNADCASGGVCVAANCTSDADCAQGQWCAMTNKCGPSSKCGASEGICVDRPCSVDAACAAGSVCRPDPKDPCSSPGVECVNIARHICQAPCAGLDEASCVARRDCGASYGPNDDAMVFVSCSDRWIQ